MNEPISTFENETPKEPLSRRGFLTYAGLLSFSAAATAVGVLTPIIAYLWPPKQGGGTAGGLVDVASTDDLPLGQGQVYSVNNKPVLVMHTEDGFKAVSATCTHLGCIVYWDPEKQVVSCPCHEAYFNTGGGVISGPPPAPLEEYGVLVETDQIFVEGGES